MGIDWQQYLQASRQKKNIYRKQEIKVQKLLRIALAIRTPWLPRPKPLFDCFPCSTLLLPFCRLRQNLVVRLRRNSVRLFSTHGTWFSAFCRLMHIKLSTISSIISPTKDVLFVWLLAVLVVPIDHHSQLVSCKLKLPLLHDYQNTSIMKNKDYLWFFCIILQLLVVT